MEIERMLVLSTSHLTELTCNTILPSWQGPAYEKVGYGWFVYANLEFATNDAPEDLKQCLKYAQNPGVSCDWVMFDRDAETVDDLPTYDW